MLRIEAKIPGFGGFFRDSTGQVIVYVKRGSPASHASIRALLAATYSKRPEALVREAMETAATAKVIEGEFSLSELIAYENRINYSSTPVAGYTACGVSIGRNRVLLGLANRESLEPALQRTDMLGIPREALKVEIWGKLEAATTWDSDVRPVRGGLKIGVISRTRYPVPPYSNGTAGWGSAGYNIRTTSGGNYLMTAAHVLNEFGGVNGELGDTITQSAPKWDGFGWKVKPIGITYSNPIWTVGPSNCNTAGVDYCTSGDVALIAYLPGISFERKIATSQHEGLNGSAGTDEINGYYSISGVIPPEMVIGGSLGVHKSGAFSGTTTGSLDAGVISINIPLCWGIASTVPGPCPSRTIRWINVTVVRGMLTRNGDSGGVAFAGNGSPYAALGIVIGRGGELDGNKNCVDPDLCFTFFHKWSALENALGMGTLNPATTQ